ncbi:MAG TPA: crossover junction endodeoxyribonuclease RuvC [Bacteroidetes bacterium]|uniref:Crossover junction endodeoxyribonuclease RuvC n=1 Tax=candidate division TA06 bacterium TaxID=2250710 RepID=A0A660SBN3_UNCT6|nr:MAG: crossover junction endodeoxyribonuclease RuvC [candidate division TA06 bacterium]HHD82482.1 crossover junction endodeoxyribonuclease RuvC [Bacteroidota bacterium]
MKAIGIDPGFRNTGYAIIEYKQYGFKLVEYGLVKTNVKEDVAVRLMTIFSGIDAIIKDKKPDLFAIETVFSGKSYQSSLKLGQARAAAIIAASVNGLKVKEFAPREVKKIVTGKGNASKSAVKYMVEKLLNIEIPQKENDISDACAIAIGCLMDYDRENIRNSYR